MVNAAEQYAADTVSKDLEAVIRAFITDLPERTRDIVLKRYGLDRSRKMTLEEIGKAYEITRERVRQIESAALKELKSSEKMEDLIPTEDIIEHIIADYGHIMEHQYLVEKSKEELPGDVHDNHVEFVLHISDRFFDNKETDEYNKHWYIKDADLRVPEKVIQSFIEILEEKNEPVNHGLAVEHVVNHPKAEEITDEKRDSERVKSYLLIGKRIKRNPFDEWGLAHWSEIIPRGVKDKAYIILKKEGKPLHFTEITKKINEAGFSKKEAIAQTVHNELIKDGRFVLVGRGIYALTSWGYQTGTVADVVLDVLKNADGPLTKEEIVEKVRKQRLVKKNTIVLALQSRDAIQKQGDGFVYVTKS
ncbi:hypothetical protein KKH43_06215 [Patescibacteria group bacterium]|nr:hypothetical protein [Patescibacteria group bacterium]